jgi:hypothetical protein
MRKYLLISIFAILFGVSNLYADKFDLSYIYGINPNMTKPQVIKILKKHHVKYFDSVDVIKFEKKFTYKIFHIDSVEFHFDFIGGGELNSIELLSIDDMKPTDIITCLSSFASGINNDGQFYHICFDNCVISLMWSEVERNEKKNYIELYPHNMIYNCNN